MKNPFEKHSSPKDFRRTARDTLHTHWGNAVGVTLLAAIFGAFSGAVYGFESTFTQNIDRDVDRFNAFFQSVFSFIQRGLDALPFTITLPSYVELTIYQLRELLEVFLVISLCAAGLSLFWFLIGGTTRVGLCRWQLQMNDGETPSASVLFFGFGEIFWKCLFLRILRFLFVFLWSLLLIFPGVIAAYRFSMAEYVLAENPNLSVYGALKESSRIMKHNKFRLFRLRFSFLGWILLTIPFLNIGFLWLKPYIEQAKCAFYHEVSGRVTIREAVLDIPSLDDL